MISLTIIIESKHFKLINDFTEYEKICGISSVNDSACECNLKGPDYEKWVIFVNETEEPGPNRYDYDFYQISSVTNLPSPDGFFLMSDRYECPDDVDSCEMINEEFNTFSVTSQHKRIANMNLQEWNYIKNEIPNVSFNSTTSYKCIFKANQTGYLAIEPVIEKVMGWTFSNWCKSSHCWPSSHPCPVCPKIPRAVKSQCGLLGKAPKINIKDGTVSGKRLCVVADNEEDAIHRAKNHINQSEFISLPVLISRQKIDKN